MAVDIASDEPSPPVLNEKYAERRDFPQFASLPWELRNQVWMCALQRRRLIRVDLKETQPSGITERESRDIKYGRPSLFVNGPQVLSKLLRVNSEARAAALEFYRVRLPCVLTRPGSRDADAPGHVGVFHFNPEHDILWFDQVAHLADFVAAVFERDSRRVGLCNLAIPMTNIRLALSTDDDDDDDDDDSEDGEDDGGPSTRESSPAFTEAVNNIREFYLITETTSYALDGVREGFNDHAPHAGATPITQNLSPLMSSVPAFDILRRDPRPVGRELGRLFLGSCDLSQEISDWKRRVRDWGVDLSRVEARLLFMYGDVNPCFPVQGSLLGVSDLDQLRTPPTNRLLHDPSSSPSSSAVPAIQLTVEEPMPKAGEEDDLLAFGFWLFPLDAFTHTNKVRHPTRSVDVWDLSDYWPELGLAHSFVG